MILGIDVGNTNIVMALMHENNIANTFRFDTCKHNAGEYYRKHIKEFVRNEDIDGVIISSVVPEINRNLKEACMDITDHLPVFVSAELKMEIVIKYDRPDKLGADLISVAVGAVHKYKSPVIIIDIGTATTFSVVNAKKEYLGGVIAPGPFISMKALAENASQLPEIQLTPTDKVIGTNTVDCIKIGILTAHAAMIDGMIDRIKSNIDAPDANIIVTGGVSEEIISMCSHKIICDKDLIFNGLYELYKTNHDENTN